MLVSRVLDSRLLIFGVLVSRALVTRRLIPSESINGRILFSFCVDPFSHLINLALYLPFLALFYTAVSHRVSHFP